VSCKDDIFDFWSGMKLGQKVHPSDKLILERSNRHLDLNCLPSPFLGPLKTAPIVLLYLNPGLSAPDYKDAESKAGQRRCLEQLGGKSFLPGVDEHRMAHAWLLSRTKLFGNWEFVQRSLAILELCPYHSSSFKDWHLLAALPSARKCLDWAQAMLFEEAVMGKRTVICMRSPGYWGLKSGERYGKSLFAPRTNIAGHLLNSSKGEILSALEHAA
jgi:hypothetical protein